MAEDVFRQSRKKITPDELKGDSPLDGVQAVQQQIAKETGKEVARPFEAAPFEISGNVPPDFRKVLLAKQQEAQQNADAGLVRPVAKKLAEEDESYEPFEAPPDKPRAQARKATPDSKVRAHGSDQLEGLLQKLANTHQWETFTWPSRGKFYSKIPETVQVRAMTGEEEQILGTPRWVKKGKAIDMIFSRCIKETFDTEELLSADRTNLLIYLRGISYTPEYDVEIKCPNCNTKFPHVINLDQIDVDVCPDDFGPDSLQGTLPVSGFNFKYRLATGQDEQEIQNYREKRIQQWGDQSEDDTLLYRTALLLEEIEGVSMKKELALLLKKLPIRDVGYLRNEINNPPFGVDTQLPLLCPNCNDEFKIDLPLETNFFFPRKKPEKTQA